MSIFIKDTTTIINIVVGQTSQTKKKPKYTGVRPLRRYIQPHVGIGIRIHELSKIDDSKVECILGYRNIRINIPDRNCSSLTLNVLLVRHLLCSP